MALPPQPGGYHPPLLKPYGPTIGVPDLGPWKHPPKKKPPPKPPAGTSGGLVPPGTLPAPNVPFQAYRPAAPFTPPPRAPVAYPTTLLPYADEDLYKLASQRANDAIEPERLAITNARAQARKYASADESLYTGLGDTVSGMLSGVNDPDFKKILAAQVASDTRHRVAQQQNDDSEYERQLVELAAKQPQYRDQALDALFNREMDKLSARMQMDQANESQYEFDYGQAQNQYQFGATQAENARQYDQSYGLDKSKYDETVREFDTSNALDNKKFNEDVRRYGLDHALAARAQRVNEGQLGIQTRAETLAEQTASQDYGIKLGQLGVDQARTAESIRQNKASEQLNWANLKVRNIGQAQSYQAALARIQASGDKLSLPSAALSAKYGHIVDARGHDILDASGKKIPIKVSTAQKKAANTKLSTAASTEALSLLGDPIPAPTSKNKYTGKPVFRGAYKVKPGQKGYGDGSTDDPNKAIRDTQMPFAQAQTYLASKYGLTRAQARAKLIAAGWVADGKRPRGSRPGLAPGNALTRS